MKQYTINYTIGTVNHIMVVASSYPAMVNKPPVNRTQIF